MRAGLSKHILKSALRAVSRRLHSYCFSKFSNMRNLNAKMLVRSNVLANMAPLFVARQSFAQTPLHRRAGFCQDTSLSTDRVHENLIRLLARHNRCIGMAHNHQEVPRYHASPCYHAKPLRLSVMLSISFRYSPSLHPREQRQYI